MQRATWVVLLGAVCVGCGKKEPPELPNVELTPTVPGGPVSIGPADLLMGKVVALDCGKLWDPAWVKDPQALKEVLAQQHFAQHPRAYLTASTVGALVSATPQSPHGFTVFPVLIAAHPEVVRKMESWFTERLQTAITGNTAKLDTTTFAPGGPANRVVVLRVSGESDDLRTRFEAYLARLDEAVRGTGATVSGHQRGGPRLFAAPLSDLRYETATRTGSVRSLIVSRYHQTDHDLTNTMLGDVAVKDGRDLCATVMTEAGGPYLVVVLKERPR
jgi:hypothetical protein